MGTSNFGAEAAPSWLTPANLTNPEAEPNRVHVAIRSGKSWSTVLNPALQGLTGKKQSEAKEYLGDLTYLETQQLVFALARPADDVLDTFKDAAERGTMK